MARWCGSCSTRFCNVSTGLLTGLRSSGATLSDCLAADFSSTAAGFCSTAAGFSSTAAGFASTAAGFASTVVGFSYSVGLCLHGGGFLLHTRFLLHGRSAVSFDKLLALNRKNDLPSSGHPDRHTADGRNVFVHGWLRWNGAWIHRAGCLSESRAARHREEESQ